MTWSFPPAKRGRAALRDLVRSAGLFALAIVACAVTYQVAFALVGATLAALGTSPYAADGWARIGGVSAVGLLAVVFYVRRVP
jgi:hypothetical protein